ncbi:MAG: CHAP domain-containing protein [Bacteroidota bacterium]
MLKRLSCLFVLLSVWACSQAPKLPESEMGEAVVTIKEKVGENKMVVGEEIDRYNGIPIYYNGDMHNTAGRSKGPNGYNYGLKWQCVEFVKRYYYEYLHHKMPNTWGHAKDFFNLFLQNGAYNADRAMYQYRNGSRRKPRVDDILVFGSQTFGHVAIISAVEATYIEVAQQNVGPFSRTRYKLTERNGRWYIRDSKVLGWLSLE